MDKYLAFVDEIGKSADGKYMYRFDFTYDKDTVWGDFFNITPAVIVPDLQPDKKCLCYEAKANFSEKLLTAKRNSCFSMQDCFDGIIPLCFCDIDEDPITIGNDVLLFNFGETFDEVKEKCNKLSIELYDMSEVTVGDASSIDDLINGDTLNNKDDFDDEE